MSCRDKRWTSKSGNIRKTTYSRRKSIFPSVAKETDWAVQHLALRVCQALSLRMLRRAHPKLPHPFPRSTWTIRAEMEVAQEQTGSCVRDESHRHGKCTDGVCA